MVDIERNDQAEGESSLSRPLALVSENRKQASSRHPDKRYRPVYHFGDAA